MSTTPASTMTAQDPMSARGPRYTFEIPASARFTAEDPKSITLVALTLDQELSANQLVAKSNNPWDKVKMCLIAVNGTYVDWGTGQVDKALAAMSPKVRELLFAAFRQIHMPDDKASADFLASMTVAV